MNDIVKRLVVERGKHDSLKPLLRQKRVSGEHPDYFLKHLNRLHPAPAREVEIVCFRPAKEEHQQGSKGIPGAYAARKLRAGSLFELLALVPDGSDSKGRDEFVRAFGARAFLMAHAHYCRTWLRDQEAYLSIERGFIQDCSAGILCSETQSWYIGYRTIRPQPAS